MSGVVGIFDGEPVGILVGDAVGAELVVGEALGLYKFVGL